MDITQLEQLVVSALEDIKGKDIRSSTPRASPPSSTRRHRQRRLQPPDPRPGPHVADKAREAGIEVIGIEGEGGGEWVLVDLGAIVVHVMQPAVRSYYNLEELWAATPARPRRAA
jgi:ribosome-associated protein